MLYVYTDLNGRETTVNRNHGSVNIIRFVFQQERHEFCDFLRRP